MASNNIVQKDDDDFDELTIASAKVVEWYFNTCLLKEPSRTSILSGYAWVMELLHGNPNRCWQTLRMYNVTFRELCNCLVRDHGLEVEPRGLAPEEKVAIFITHLAHRWSNRVLQERFQHSGETISRILHQVLKAVFSFSKVLIQPTRSQEECHPHLTSQRHYRPFKDCIGAIDGTHVLVRAPADDVDKYYGRKGVPTQNIMAACDFDMLFVFVSAGWEGAMHDSRVFSMVINDPGKKFPHPQQGKYYLVDAGYPNKSGYLTPFKGARYHHQVFRNGNRPRNDKEIFNKAHSSLRSVIERTFGVWKARWAILRDMPPYSIKTQAKIVCASMALHNFIRRANIQDDGFDTMVRLGDRYNYEMRDNPLDEAGPSQPPLSADNMDALRLEITRALKRNTNRG